jgi:hypothetical protein
MMTFRLSRIAATAATVMSIIGLILSACVPAQQYDALENDYNRLNQQLSGEIASQQEQRLTDHVNGGNGGQSVQRPATESIDPQRAGSA